MSDRKTVDKLLGELTETPDDKLKDKLDEFARAMRAWDEARETKNEDK